MIGNGTLATIVSLIGSPEKYVSQRAMYAMAAFAAHGMSIYPHSLREISDFVEDGCVEVIKENTIPKLIPMLHKGALVCDVLEVITRLCSRGMCLISIIM
jgi:hypothetical protein